jgi:threonine/homoserine/homoserine lactone efflux protein
LCIQRTIAYGRTSGLLTGLGAATADALYGAVAAFGLTLISTLLVDQQFWFRLLGGAFLLYLGLRTFATTPAARAPRTGHKSLVSDYLTTVGLTLTNPTTILSFIAVFAGLGLGATGSVASATLMVSGVFLGSALWWLILSSGVGLMRGRFTPASLRVVNRLSGVMIAAFGVSAFASLGLTYR